MNAGSRLALGGTLPVPSSIAGPRKRWRLRERLDSDLLQHLARVRQIDDLDSFLSPAFSAQLHDPYLMKDMDRTVTRLAEAIERGETIGVFADYDTDGTPGAALFLDGLDKLGASTRVYIAMRHEGYGLSETGLQKLIDAGASLIVTIDLGITGRDCAAFAREQGVDLIVTDHHLVQPEVFPSAAYAVVNPKQTDCPYPFKELAGGGVIWKVLVALIDRLAETAPERFVRQKPQALQRWCLDLAAISTICDMVPLVGENRVLAHYGLIVLRKTRRPGLRALCKLAGVSPEKIDAVTVGFQIGPRINAPTRLNAASYVAEGLPGPQLSPALALLLTADEHEAEALAQLLDSLNRDRQAQTQATLAAAVAKVDQDALDRNKVILVAEAGWPVGIVGLVAGRLMERYGKPAIVLSIDGAVASGSARSIDGFHLGDALAAVRQYLVKYGGHAKAAGLTVALEQLPAAYQAILSHADQVLPDELGPELPIDARLDQSDLSMELAETLARLAPFGIGNPRPTFLIQGVRITERRPVGAHGQHMKLRLMSPSSQQDFSAIAFGQGGRIAALDIAQPIDIACELEINEWNHRRELVVQVLDLQVA